MKTKSLILFVLLICITFSPILDIQRYAVVEAADQDPEDIKDDIVVVRVYYDDMDDISLLSSFDLFEYNNKAEKYVLVAINRKGINQIVRLGFDVVIDEIETENFQLLFTIPENKIQSLDGQIETIPGYSCYRTVEETFAAAAAIATNHPNLAEWIDVGNSWEKSVGQPDGYDMMVLRLTNENILGEKPKLFITAAIHAREYTTAELATRFAEHLIANYNVDPDITWILDSHEIHLMLQTNPDGRKEAEAGYSWRKNTNENYCGVTSTNRGADLNRNYSFYWNSCSGCSSGNPCDATYRGPSPASEPEVQAVQAYMRSIFPDQRDASLSSPAPTDATGIFIDLHSYSQLVLWPWGMTSNSAPNGPALQTLGRKFAYFNSYTPEPSSDLYGTDGDSVDFAYGELGIAAYTFELGTRFFEYCSTFENTIYPNNLPALLYAAKAARTPYMTPAGPDALSVAVSKSAVYEGESVTLTATINDTRYNNSNGTEATQNIAAAEFYVDTPFWEDGATPLVMSAVDGAFDEKVEDVTFSINTTGWPQGRHMMYVRGRDANGNWGAVSAVFLTVEDSDNEPPVANDLNLSTDEDVAVGVSLSGSDPDEDPLSFSVVDQPVNGILSGTPPDLTYTPAADYFGTDSFTYKANDGIADSNLATVNITIDALNDAPVAESQSVTTEINSPVTITLTGSDVDGDGITYIDLSNPTHGSLSGIAPDLLYTPDTSFIGEDAFTFKVSDGLLDSEVATMTITVNPPGPVQVFWDDFESDQGWMVDPDGSDSATTGLWELANPESVDYYGYKQLGDTVSGTRDLVTGHLAGSSAGSYDIDGGVTTIRSPLIPLPVGRELTLSFYYYLAHYTNATSDDYLRVTVEGESDQVVFEELGAANDDDAAWDFFSTDISAFGGQTVTLLFAAADAGTASLVEAAVDDVLIEGLLTNNPPFADPQSVTTDEDTEVGMILSGSDVDGDPLTYIVSEGPSNGILSGTAPALTYNPNTDFNGSDSFTFVVNDGKVNSAPAMVSVSVNPVNDTPVANPQSVVTNKNTAVVITLTGSDVDDDSLTYAVTVDPEFGTLSGTAPNLTYTPTTGYSGTDSFAFSVSDGQVVSEPAVVSITVTDTNDAPVAIGQSISTDEDTPSGVTLSGSDPDGDPISFTVVDQPVYGSLSGIAPELTYTPDTNFNGSDSFTFTVYDGQLTSAPATVSITVNPINDAPVAEGQLISLDEDSTIAISLVGTDVEDDPLTYILVSGPYEGVLEGTGSARTYTPTANYYGQDSFTFKVNDGNLDSLEATVSITIASINDLPVADDQILTTDEDSPLAITLTGSDVESTSLAFSIGTGPTHGTLSGDAPELTYIPSLNFNGSDSFSFVANDGTGDSLPAKINITIIAVNDAPVANPQSVVTNENTAASIILTGSDVDGDVLTYSVTVEPVNGTLTGTAPDLIYTPNTGYFGSDSLEFTVYDGQVTSSAAIVTITVTEVNEPPVANGQEVSTDEDTELPISLTGSDPDGNPLNYSVTSQPAHGTLSGTEPELIYIPTDNFYGADSFNFTVDDGQLTSDPASVTITVKPVNDAPVVDDIPDQTVAEGESFATISLDEYVSDVDNADADMTWEAAGQSELSVSIVNRVATITIPDEDWNGAETITFKATDTGLLSDEDSVTFTVTAVNDAPVVGNIPDQTILEGESFATIYLDDYVSDVDNDDEEISWEAIGKSDLIVSIVNRVATIITPDSEWSGDETITFTATDLGGLFDSDSATFTVTTVNDAPVVDDIPDQTVAEGESFATISLDEYISDVDNSDADMTWEAVGQSELSVSIVNRVATITLPDEDWNGAETITFKATDPGSLTDEDSAIFTVTAINDAPVAADDSFEVAEGTALVVGASALTANDIDVDGDSLLVTNVANPVNGTVNLTDTTITFTPDISFNGIAGFEYTVSDGELMDEGYVTVNVTEENDAPIVSNIPDQTIEEGENFTNINLDDYVSDADHSDQEIIWSYSGANDLTITISTERIATITVPNEEWSGTETITFRATDPGSLFDEDTATFTVIAVNDAPVVSDIPDQTIPEGETFTTISLDDYVSDVDNADADITWSYSGAIELTVVISGDRIATLTVPSIEWNGSEVITFRAADPGSLFDEDAATFTITAINDAPVVSDIPDQTISEGESFATISLDGYVSDVDNSDGEITWEAVGQSDLSVSISDRIATITAPDADWNGAETITFKATDPGFLFDEDAATFTVTAVNDAPVAVDDNFEIAEGTALIVEASALTANDTDVDSTELIVTAVTNPVNGTVSLVDTTITFTPNALFTGTAGFEYTVSDGEFSDEGYVKVVVTEVNDDPIVSDIPDQTIAEGESFISIDLDDYVSDVDNSDEEITWTVSGQSELSVSIVDRIATIVAPDPDWNGSEAITFKATDPGSLFDEDSATFTVTAVNDAPVVSDIPDQTIPEGENFATISLDDFVSDVDNADADMTWSYSGTNELTVDISGDRIATLTIPSIEWNGSETITFTATDPGFLFDQDAASFTVTAVNDPPVADSQAVSTNQNISVEIVLSGSDADNDPLTFIVTGDPSHGELTGTGANRIYTPNSGYSGPDSFTFVVNDGTIDSDPATVSIAVINVNFLPIVFNQSLSTAEDVNLAIELTGSDQDGDPLDFFILAGPSNGTLTGNAPEMVYTPDPDFNGSDFFTFYANDGQGDSDPGTINIIVNPVNDAPIAYDQALTTEQGSPLNITLIGSDVDDESLTFAVVDSPNNGSLSENFPEVTYTPDNDFTGEDSFTFVVNDGELDSETATVSINVTPSGPTQIFWDDFETDLGWVVNPYGRDTATTGVWERANPEPIDYNGMKQLGDTVSGSYDLVTGALAGSNAGSYDIDNGVTSILSPEITLPIDRELALSFSYYLAHANNATNDDFLRLYLIGTTNELVFEDLGGSFDDDAVWEFAEVNLSQFAGQTIRILIEAADAGTASLVEAGIDDVLIMAQRPNNPPIANSQELSLDEDGTLDITLSGSDPNGDPLTFELISNPQHGSLNGILPEVTYIPDANFNGQDSFSFAVNDGIVSSDPALITTEVVPVNDAPIAESQSAVTTMGTAVEIVLTGSDVDGDSLNFSLLSDPSHGTLSGTAPNLLYTPNAGYTGSDSFNFKVDDGALDSNTGVVDVTVNPAGPVTVFFDDFESDMGWTFNPFGSDTATAGLWNRTDPTVVNLSGYKQLEAYSGSNDLVTGPAGLRTFWWWTWSVDDINNGITSARSPEITLPYAANLTLSLQYYFAHDANSSSDDYLRIKVVGSSTQTIFEELGAGNDDDAAWESMTLNLNDFAGQTIYLLIEAADAGSSSLVEAAVDDIMILAE